MAIAVKLVEQPAGTHSMYVIVRTNISMDMTPRQSRDPMVSFMITLKDPQGRKMISTT